MKHNNGNPVVRLQNIGVFYWRKTGLFRQKRFWVLDNVSLEVRYGETLGVIGRNGVGKSTLLRVMAGIIAPDRGKILNNGVRASLLSLQAGFSPHLTGRENAILNGMLLGMRRKEVESKMDEIISFSDLGPFMDQPIKSYSSGMKARLGFAVAFQADPELLLVDEVIGVGDAAFRAKSVAAMSERIKSDRTVVLVSHSPQTIRELCDRVIWIEDGMNRGEGDPGRILEDYQKHVKKSR